MSVSRRAVLAGGAMAAAAAATATNSAMASNAPRFSLKYAPHEGSFKSRGGRLEQIAFAADQGFTAWEDNEAATRSVADQTAMARALQQRGMTMGVFVASMPRWSEFRPLLGGNDDSDRERFLTDIRGSVDVAKRLNSKHMTIVTGFMDRKLPVDIQTARVIDVLRRAADIYEPHGLVMVMEPLNTLVNHPGVFMSTVPQGYAMARAVDSPAIKVLADLYHEQIQAGNLINTLDSCWNEIAYVQFGDNPGRKEPGTGEINYRNIVRWLRAKKFAGVIGMEHGNSVEGRAGEERLVAAYRAIDAA
ncbi:xylose isomerase [Sphingopyxis sp. H038]|nr:xylose isomerase [Sphingopyxis sp. H012]KTE08651.1 xylose isomerase [Sphingopyxis sp. H053]KTE10177.1 xylose isomerase [Sphingopyxis sp. H093]KTE24024.1 xylose isomerase [Sphingopyxis sp. H080]KTE33822.1 xylose isomerase [Sphingopyxis sp. H038]KTE38663.1 xylose isomerase [Sphingopyxis sp. H077]KTE41663.1 xylose isomerase [Sphingopyxis sp. H005]KTE66651.1 xylose isomerase [Sphingopyxis sp. H085]